jgi:hypothetical protein
MEAFEGNVYSVRGGRVTTMYMCALTKACKTVRYGAIGKHEWRFQYRQVEGLFFVPT